MNILIVSQYFWPESFRINDLARGLKERGHAVTVLTGLPNYPEGRIFDGYGLFKGRLEDFDGIRIVRSPLLPRGNSRSLRLMLNYLSFAALGCLVGGIHCRGPFDCILAFEPSPVTVGIPAVAMKRLTSAPLLFWVQDLWPETLQAVGATQSPRILGMVERVVRFIYTRCDLILIQARSFRESVTKYCGPAVPVEYFPNSAEQLYRPVPVAEDAPVRRLMGPGFKVVFAGNLGVAQDLPTLVAAAELTRDVPEIKWIVIGDGRQREWLQSEVAARGLTETVRLVGKFPAEEMPSFFALADALLVTLKRDPIFAMTIPSKVQSYLACARPVIAALDGEGAAVVEEAGAGVCCPAESPEALAGAVLKLYALDPQAREAMGARGREYFEKHFEREMLIDRLEGWMRELKPAPVGSLRASSAG